MERNVIYVGIDVDDVRYHAQRNRGQTTIKP